MCALPALAPELWNVIRHRFPADPQAMDLFCQFLSADNRSERFASRLIREASGETAASWELRCAAVLMLENLMLHALCDCREVYTWLESRQVEIAGLLPKLRRLERIHAGLRGTETTPQALADFAALSTRACKLALARYFFSPAEIVDRIAAQTRITAGVRDTDAMPSDFWAWTAADRILWHPHEYEREILKTLCREARIYWVSEQTSSELNALVEYPLTTAALVVKPPGSDCEFEIKRAGVRGSQPLSVHYDGDGVSRRPAHRLHGGCAGFLAWHEANESARFAHMYRLIHGAEAPVSSTAAINIVQRLPLGDGDSGILEYFTDPVKFGPGYSEMRTRLDRVVALFDEEAEEEPLSAPDEIELTARFLDYAGPRQLILYGSSSFRLDRLARYLSHDGPQAYFEEGLRVSYTRDDARRFADDVLEEVLGVYTPPATAYSSHGQYVSDALDVPANRARADQAYRSVLQQIGSVWATLAALGGFSDGESFAARNVGLKSQWLDGAWQVRALVMDHDGLHLPSPSWEVFPAARALDGIRGDERYIRGKPGSGAAMNDVEYLKNIYFPTPEIAGEGDELLRQSIHSAYRATRQAMATEGRLRSLFAPTYLEDYDRWESAAAHFPKRRDHPEYDWQTAAWQELAAGGCTPGRFQEFCDAMVAWPAFLEKYHFLFDSR